MFFSLCYFCFMFIRGNDQIKSQYWLKYLFQILLCILPFENLPIDGQRLRPAGRLLVPQLRLSRRNSLRFRLSARNPGKNSDRTIQSFRKKTGKSKNYYSPDFAIDQGARSVNGLREKREKTKKDFFQIASKFWLVAFLCVICELNCIGQTIIFVYSFISYMGLDYKTTF